MQMDQLTAFLALAVKADFHIYMNVWTNIFKTGRAVSINDIFVQYSLIYQAFQLSINC